MMAIVFYLGLLFIAALCVMLSCVLVLHVACLCVHSHSHAHTNQTEEMLDKLKVLIDKK